MYIQTFLLHKKELGWWISILADFDPIRYALSCSASLSLGYDFLSKSILGHCMIKRMAGV